jgi:serine/threonine protein phosphatase PrpC
VALCPDQEYILLGSDGIFDYLDNQSIHELVLGYSQNTENSLHFCCAEAVNAVIRAAMQRESTDNLSVVIIALKPFMREITVRRLPSEIREMPSSARTR